MGRLPRRIRCNAFVGASATEYELTLPQAVTDVPAACFIEELIAAYPQAKVILTTRPVDS